jgi:biotin operon repressor
MSNHDVGEDFGNGLTEPHRTVYLLRKLGKTFGEIAEELHVSRSSIAGIVNRLRGRGYDMSFEGEEGRREKMKHVTAGRLNSLAKGRIFVRPPKSVRSAESKVKPAGPFKGCQYITGDPVGDDGCKCGEPVQQGSSFCPTHHAKCFIKPSKPDEQTSKIHMNFRPRGAR